MNRRSALRLACCLPLLLAAPRLRAQSDTEGLAAAVVRSLAPAVDEVDAVVTDLLTTALQHRRSPAAPFLVEEATRWLHALQQPAALRSWLRSSPDRAAGTGLLALRLRELEWYLDRAVTGPRAAGRGTDDQPFPEYATSVLVAGPFGDQGDHFVGVPFPPELQFPAIGNELPGRGTTARVRAVERKRDRRRIDLGEPARELPGCYYALQRVAVAAPSAVYLEVEHEGAFQLFVDGTEVLRVEPWLEPGPARRYVPLQMPQGPHELLVKTCSLEHRAIALRWVEASGAASTAVQPLPVDATPQPIAAAATDTGAPFVGALDVFTRAATAPTATATLRIAALRCAVQQGAVALALTLADLLQRDPPTEPTALLALASLLPNLDLPDELRAAAARTLEEKAIALLPREHHHARFAEARLLEQQDRREDALRLLAAHPAPGPATWSYRHALAQRLHFDAENVPLLHDWVKACPRDPRPLVLLAEVSRRAGEPRGALDLLRQAAALRPDQTTTLQRAFELALDLGETGLADDWLAQLAPIGPGEPASLERLKAALRIAARQADTARYRELLGAIGTHRDADPATLLRTASRATELGDAETVLAALHRSLALDPDQPTVHAWLAELGVQPVPGADFAAFRRDGDAARAAFQPGDRESGATSTLLLDQRIVEFQADGSWLAELHELRRINDLAGVEEFRSAGALGNAAEVLLLRTIGADGRSYVPPKVQDEYALQRLEPGTFVEMRYRERGSAPGPDPLRTERFYFQSGDAASLLGELVLILPATGRGELRSHALGEPTRQTTLADGRRVLVFTRSDTPRLPQERWSPSLGALVPFAEFGEDELPYARLRETRVQLLRRTRPTPAIRSAAATLFQGLADDRARLAAAWTFCQREIEDGNAETASHAILRRKGSRFLVAVALLRAADIAVVMTACRAERAELGDGDDALFQAGFENQLPGAMVTLASGEVVHLFIDAPRHWPLGAIPAGRGGTNCFAITDTGIRVVTLPHAVATTQDLRVRGQAVVVGNDLQLSAELVIGDAQGFALAERIAELKEDVRKLAARQIAQQLLPGWRVQSAAVVTDAPGEPFRLQCKAQRNAVQQNADRALLPLPLAPGRFLASFGDRAERRLPARLAIDMASDWEISLDPGADLAFAELPPPQLVQHGGLLYQLTTERLGNLLRIHRTVRMAPMTMAPERFGDWLRALAAADRADQQSLQLTARSR